MAGHQGETGIHHCVDVHIYQPHECHYLLRKPKEKHNLKILEKGGRQSSREQLSGYSEQYNRGQKSEFSRFPCV